MRDPATASAPGPADPPGGPRPSAVLAENLGKTYPGGTVAVDGLNLAVRRGEVLGLLGPNGAGKSTTAGMLTTTVRPTAGRAWVAGVTSPRPRPGCTGTSAWSRSATPWTAA